MEHAEFVLTGYGAVLGAMGGYAAWLVRRGRALARRVPPEQRRWSDS